MPDLSAQEYTILIGELSSMEWDAVIARFIELVADC